jgi:hypothetical protein
VTTEPEGFREFVVARSPALLRTAWMLTGNAAAAEDLLQTALARVWPHWRRIHDGRPEASMRTCAGALRSSPPAPPSVSWLAWRSLAITLGGGQRGATDAVDPTAEVTWETPVSPRTMAHSRT